MTSRLLTPACLAMMTLLTAACVEDRLTVPTPLPTETIPPPVEICWPDPAVPRVILC